MAKDRTQQQPASGTTETTDTKAVDPKAAEGSTSENGTKAASGKGSKKGQPVPIGKRRALGLALRGLMAEVVAGNATAESPAYISANEALGKNKYTELRPQAERLAEVQEKLQAAIAAGDGTTISKLGKELNRIKMGL